MPDGVIVDAGWARRARPPARHDRRADHDDAVNGLDALDGR
jgi:hypothetical protein